VDNVALRITASPVGLADFLNLRLDGTTFSESVVHYEINGAVATAYSMAGVNYIPSINFTGEAYFGSHAIESYGGISLDEFDFLEIQSSACAAAVAAYIVAYGKFLYEITGIRNPLKLGRLFFRVSAEVGAVIAAALAIDAACGEDEM
jgi:hypothetical protein